MRLNYFNFKELNNRILLTNDLGKYLFIDKGDFKKLLSKDIDMESKLGKDLLNTGMLYEGNNLEFVENYRIAIQNVKSHLFTATSLHIFVVTTACNMNCVYCQANNGTNVPNAYMTKEIAKAAVNIALESPERYLNFEFQGGEPLVNFDIVKYIVEYAEINKGEHEIAYNIVSNLTLLNRDILEFFAKYNFNISTSLDGIKEVQNKNRPLKDGSGTFDILKEKIKLVRSYGLNIAAIETTTRYGLAYGKELVDIYSELGFNSIFVRHLTQLGKASKSWKKIGYTVDEFMSFYKDVLNEIVALSKLGINIEEQHASIFLKRINSQAMNYMELRSPCGGGIGQLAYFSDGRIFTCDEGRMLAEMGNDAFQLGHVLYSHYEDLIKHNSCKTVCMASSLETIPSCCDCVYQPYCGTCPVINYANSEDVLEKQPRNFRCQIYSKILDYLFTLISNNNSDVMNVLNKWSV